MATATYTSAGAKATTPAKLDKAVFGVEVNNHELLKLAYSAYLANGRDNLAVTKTRGLVRGGGRKPWRQKGTGRARFGSTRNPIWRGGGIVFGPTGEENYSKQLNTKAKQKATRQALTLAANGDRIKVIESFAVKDGKTASAQKLLNKVEAKGRTVVVVDSVDESLKQATNNMKNVSVVRAQYVNVYSIMNADTLIVTKPALEIINTWLGGKA